MVQPGQAHLRAPCDERFAEMRSDSLLVAACDAKHAPYLLNALASLQACFPSRPRLVVYDIGLSALQRLELAAWPDVQVLAVPAFVPHWRLNWSWKLFALTDAKARYVLYLDLANLVIQRSLAPWFLAIRRHGYLVLANGQTMGDITPVDYWATQGLDPVSSGPLPTFGAGIIGFDRQGPAYGAIELAMQLVVQGLNLGRSATEPTPKYRPDIIRDCPCFRADQTVLNLAFRKVFGHRLLVRRAARYCGAGGPADHPGQYVWYARRKHASLLYLFGTGGPGGLVRGVNRAWWAAKLALVYAVRRH